MKDISQKRHIAKTVTWRIIASLTTFAIAYFFLEMIQMQQKKQPVLHLPKP